ncbi:MAG: AMP-binding protein [Pseudomonadota bacterium]
MRAACVADPGAFHGEQAARLIHWFAPDVGPDGAWLSRDAASGEWRGWDAKTLAPVAADLGDAFTPWTRAFNGDAPPFWKWFEGGLTNACFNEADRHVLAGHGAEAALIFEGDRWDMSLNDARGGPVESYTVSRKDLLLETATCAAALKRLGLKAGDRVAINMPNVPSQLYWIEACKRLGVLYTPVFGGFSDKTLSDRIHDFGARVVITADGGHRNSQIIAFKNAFTDPALDNFVAADEARRLVDERLATTGLPDAARQTVAEAVADALTGETTVERGDVMRGVGRALAKLSLEAGEAASVRASIAEALVQSPARVDAVVVERHVSQPDMLWRPERDRWSDTLKSEGLEDILAAARAAGIDVADEASLKALPDADFVRAIWASCPPRPLDAECPMFVIYTSGSTGKPKGVVHVHGGYTAGIASTMAVAFDAQPGDVMYVVADPGWITGQSYLISAPLLTRVTSVIAEGAPVYPHAGRFASIIERYGVKIFKAGVTFLKSVMTDPESVADVRKYDMSGLRAATFCAEPTSPAVQEFGMREVTPWYANSYWATEHGGIAWTHFFDNADFPLKPNAHAYPMPWVFGDVWLDADAGDADGEKGAPPPVPFDRPGGEGLAAQSAPLGEKGEIVITAPYPYLARTVWGDAETFTIDGAGPPAAWQGDIDRYRDTYWTRWRGKWAYTQGDFGMKHPDGSFSIHGRSDDVINVSGHRLGTEEIEGAILRDKANNPANSPVGNVIVVGAPHREKGLTPLAFVTPTPGRALTQDDKKRLSDLVRQEKGGLAVPGDFIEVSQFPETRSGKYMRRMVRALVEDGPVGDASTLKNPESLDELRGAIGRWRRKQTASESQSIFERYRYFQIQYNALGDGRLAATVFVNNPPVNALNERALDELNIIVEHLSRRDDVAAVVFTGRGSSSFVAGADIRQFLDEINTLGEARALPNNAHLAFRRIEAMTKPCVAAIQGVALGGGMEFALACHYRVAEPFARFGQPEIRLRLLPGYGGTQRLPRLLADRHGVCGLIDALDLLLGGRSIDAEAARVTGLVDEIATGPEDALSLAHALVRDFAANPDQSTLGRAAASRAQALEAWRKPGAASLDEALEDAHLKAIAAQCDWAGRAGAHARCLEAVRTGWEQGFDAGLAREAALFAEAVIDPDGGKTGIREFLEKRAKPLPNRRAGARLAEDGAAEAQSLIDEGDLLPLGAPYFPGVTKLPRWQYAHGVLRDPKTGEPRFGQPKDAEKVLLAPVPEPGPNDALVYVLTSEVNFNDIWAITGIPVSSFEGHEEDIQITGSGGIALVAALGEEARREGRLKIGDLVAIYSGTNNLLSPITGLDPMYAGFAIQGYETATGSHAQFLVTQAPQLHPVRADLTLEEAGAFTLNLGTVVRALFTTLKIEAGKRIFVEGAATGTGFDALRSSVRTGLAATGLVSNAERAETITQEGAVGAINRKAPELAGAFTAVPEDPDAARAWEKDGAPVLEAFRQLNDGRLADFAVSHAGETAFPRTFQLLAPGGVVAFYGASSGYHFTFMGKEGAVSPTEMFARAGLRGDESVLVFYGAASNDLVDPVGLEILETLRGLGARAVAATTTDGQREFILSLGFEDAVAGVVSIESLKRRAGDDFDWPSALPRLPDPKEDIEAFKSAVRDFQDRTMKPFGAAVGKALRSPGNPRGAPDLVVERAGFDSLGISSALVKPYTGRVVYCEDMKGRRYSFYAPQVWTRQRRIIMPTAEIRGTHLCNAYEASRMHELIAAGVLSVTPPTVVEWDGLPAAHQSMWDNAHAGATYVVNHALPEMGLRSRDELYEAWSNRLAQDARAK